jgi:hypothetical protein
MRLGAPLHPLLTRSALIRVLVPAISFALALIMVPVPALHQIKSFSGGPHSDFAQAVYYPVRAFLDGVNPYDGSSYLAHYPVRDAFAPYLPSTLVLHLPFGFMPLATAASSYLVTAILLTLVLAILCLRLNGLKSSIPAVLLLATLIVLSRPGRQCLLLGQVTLEVVLASYVTLYYARSAPRLGGLGLAFTLFKPSYGLPLALLMLVRGDRRALVYGAFFVLLLNLPVGAILAYRAGGIHPFAEQLVTTFGGFQATEPANSPVTSPYRIDAVALVGRLVGRAPDFAGQVLVALTVFGLAALAIRMGPKSLFGQQSFGLSAGLVCAAVLLCGYHQPHDLLLLTLPFVAVASRDFYLTFAAPNMRFTMLVLFTFLAFNYTASDLVLRRLDFLAGELGFEALVRDPRALVLASLNGLALVALFCSFVITALTQPGVVSRCTTGAVSAESTG